jgi:hypothetical protein
MSKDNKKLEELLFKNTALDTQQQNQIQNPLETAKTTVSQILSGEAEMPNMDDLNNLSSIMKSEDDPVANQQHQLLKNITHMSTAQVNQLVQGIQGEKKKSGTNAVGTGINRGKLSQVRLRMKLEERQEKKNQEEKIKTEEAINNLPLNQDEKKQIAKKKKMQKKKEKQKLKKKLAKESQPSLDKNNTVEKKDMNDKKEKI